jgi:hypothetical protein
MMETPMRKELGANDSLNLIMEPVLKQGKDSFWVRVGVGREKQQAPAPQLTS